MSHRRAVILMVVVTLLWSMAGVVSRHLEGARSFEVTFWRSAFNALALAIALTALREKNKGPGVEKFHWGPTFWVLMPIVVFGFGLKIAGMILMGLFVVIVSSIGSEEFKLKPTVWLAIGLVIFCSLAFVAALKLPIPLCPGFEFFEQFRLCRV